MSELSLFPTCDAIGGTWDPCGDDRHICKGDRAHPGPHRCARCGTLFRLKQVKAKRSPTSIVDISTVPLARDSDPETSFAAGERIRPDVKNLESVVLRLYAKYGPMTPLEAEALYTKLIGPIKPTSIRCRCSHLKKHKKLLRPTGKSREGSSELELSETGRQACA